MCLVLYAVFNESSFQMGLVKNGLLLMVGLSECNIRSITLKLTLYFSISCGVHFSIHRSTVLRDFGLLPSLS